MLLASLSLCFFLWVLSPVAGWAQPAAIRAETQRLEALVQSKQEEIADLQQQLQQLENSLEQNTEAVNEHVQTLRDELNRLTALKSLSTTNPRETLGLRNTIQSLNTKLQTASLPLREAQSRLETIRTDLETRQNELQNLSAPALDSQEELQTYRQSLAELKQKAKALSSRLEKHLRPATALENDLGSTVSALDKTLDSLWRQYFFDPTPTVLAIKDTGGIQSLSRWFKYLPTYARMVLLGDIDWYALTSVALIFFALAMIPIHLWILPALQKSSLQLSMREMGPPLYWVALGLALIAATILLPSGQGCLIRSCTQLFLSWGIMLALWPLRQFQLGENAPRRNHLRLLWFLYALAIFLQDLNIPPLFLGPTWALVLTFGAIWSKKRYTSDKPRLERSIFGASVPFFFLLTLGSLTGYVHFTLFLTAAWFIFWLAVQLGTGIASLFKVWSQKSAPTLLTSLLKGAAQGIGYPLVWTGALAFLVGWIGYSLGGYPFLDDLLELKVGWGKVSFNFMRVLGVLIGFYLARSGLLVLRSLFENIIRKQGHWEKGTAESLQTIISYMVWGLFALAAMYFLGFNFTSLTVIAGGLSVGIGFGLQSIINNFVSGLILLFGRSIQPGDIVDLTGTWGQIKRINIRTTVVQTFDNSTIFVPNAELISGRITNWTHKDVSLRRKIQVGVTYGSDTETVKRLLLEQAGKHPQVFRYPEPFVRFANFGESALDFILYFWSDINNGWITESDLRFQIDQSFRDNGVEIAFPQQDLHIRSASGLDPYFAPRASPYSDPTAEGSS
ncbi:MAG: mechanosensitive ion channel domain-containing protein [Thermodesulfobacteriota bacterium]